MLQNLNLKSVLELYRSLRMLLDPAPTLTDSDFSRSRYVAFLDLSVGRVERSNVRDFERSFSFVRLLKRIRAVSIDPEVTKLAALNTSAC